jgi:hypothetical protein
MEKGSGVSKEGVKMDLGRLPARRISVDPDMSYSKGRLFVMPDEFRRATGDDQSCADECYTCGSE